jgi:predicted GIY-YIG superfamily endonuclease
MNNFIIYKIQSPSNKIYIGVTNDFNRRMNEHKSDFKNRLQKIALHHSFTKYGFENHIFSIIKTNMNKKIAYLLEKSLIKNLQLTNSKIGLNSREGGLGGNMIDWKSEKGKNIRIKIKNTTKQKYEKKWSNYYEIILELRHTHTISEICEELNISKTALINYLKYKGITIPRKNKIDKIVEEITDYYNRGFTRKQIREITGYSNGTLFRAHQQIRKE